MTAVKDFEYEVKCRKCNKINKMHFGTSNTTSIESFKIFIKEHIKFPIEKQCNCDNGMMMFHDIISYGNILNL